jgi:segregation and condensation protein B
MTPLDTADLKSLIEGLLFAAPGPLAVDTLARVVEAEPARVEQVLRQLLEEYRRAGRGFVLRQLAEGYQFRTRPEHADWLRRLHSNRPFRFSRAALEALAIVAYRQPVTRADVEYLRGVDSGGVLKTLLDKRLVRILGKKDIPGRPLLYGTTGEFLEFFGLNSLADLPTLKELSELPPEVEARLPALHDAGNDGLSDPAASDG